MQSYNAEKTKMIFRRLKKSLAPSTLAFDDVAQHRPCSFEADRSRAFPNPCAIQNTQATLPDPDGVEIRSGMSAEGHHQRPTTAAIRSARPENSIAKA
jgi:hypothetical protein